MSQHDYDLANQAGAAFRADLNLALAAMVSKNSGATAPATTYAYMTWADTTAGLLKMRNAANSAWIILGPLSAPSAFMAGALTGNTLSNNVTDATNDIDIAAGGCADATGAYYMVGSALTKRLDAAWAVGTNQGGLDTGSIANATYHVWRIARSDTGVVDVLFSLSASSPTMPSNYDYKRRIGSIMRTGGAIKAFLQTGNDFDWKAPVLNVSAAANTSATNRTLTVPTGIKVKAKIAATATSTGAAGNTVINDPDVGALAASSTNRSIFNADGANITAQMEVMTNTSAQVNTDGDGTSATITISTFGYIDERRV